MIHRHTRYIRPYKDSSCLFQLRCTCVVAYLWKLREFLLAFCSCSPSKEPLPQMMLERIWRARFSHRILSSKAKQPRLWMFTVGAHSLNNNLWIFTGESNHPEALMHSPLFQISPYFRKNFGLRGKLSQFYHFRTNFSIFIRQNFWRPYF